MQGIACLKTFNTEELCHLLEACAHNLAMAYQETLEKSLYLTSEEAYQARDYLMYEIQRQLNNHKIH